MSQAKDICGRLHKVRCQRLRDKERRIGINKRIFTRKGHSCLIFLFGGIFAFAICGWLLGDKDADELPKFLSAVITLGGLWILSVIYTVIYDIVMRNKSDEEVVNSILGKRLLLGRRKKNVDHNILHKGK